MPTEEKEKIMEALRESEKTFNDKVGEVIDPAYVSFSAKAELLDMEFEESLWTCEIRED